MFYLAVLLVALTFMYRTQGGSVGHAQPAEFARRALAYAYLLIVLQDLLVLVMLPVYVAGAIAEEKENQTLEVLSLTPEDGAAASHGRRRSYPKTLNRVK